VWCLLAVVLAVGVATSLLLRGGSPGASAGPSRSATRAAAGDALAPPGASEPRVPAPVEGAMGVPMQVGVDVVTVLSANTDAGRPPRSDRTAALDRVVSVRVRYHDAGREPVLVAPTDWLVTDSERALYAAATGRRTTDLRQQVLAAGRTVQGTIEFDVRSSATGLRLQLDSDDGLDVAIVPLS